MSDVALLPAWQESIDPVLLRRLARPLEQAGVIPLDIARRIVAQVDWFSARLSLLQELSKKRGDSGNLRSTNVPLVHARWVTQEIVRERLHNERQTEVHIALPKVVGTFSSVVETRTFTRVIDAPKDGAARPNTLDRVPRISTTSHVGAPVVRVNAPARGAQAPPHVDLAPAAVTAVPHVVFGSPDVGKTLPQAVLASPDVGKILPHADLAPPDVRQTARQADLAPPDVRQTAQQADLAPPDVGKILPHAVGALPDIRQAAPHVVGTLPDVGKASGHVVFALPDIKQASASRVHPSKVVVATSPKAVDVVAHGDLPHLRVAPAESAAAPVPGGSPHASSVARAVPMAIVDPQPVPKASPVVHQPAPEPDIEALVDRVEKKLLRRIAADRDRRGGMT